MAKFAIHNMDLYYNTFHALKKYQSGIAGT